MKYEIEIKISSDEWEFNDFQEAIILFFENNGVELVGTFKELGNIFVTTTTFQFEGCVEIEMNKNYLEMLLKEFLSGMNLSFYSLFVGEDNE